MSRFGKIGIEKYMAAGFIMAGTLLLLGVLIWYHNYQTVIQSGENISRTYKALYEIESLKREITDIESYTRAYVITGDPNFSAITSTTLDSAYARGEMLKKLFSGNSVQLLRLDSIGKLAESSTKGNRYIRNLVKAGKQKEAVSFIETGAVVNVSKQIRQIADRMKNEEQTNLTLGQEVFNIERHRVSMMNIARVILIIVTLFCVYLLISFNLRDLRQAQAKLRETTYMLRGLIEHAPVTFTVKDIKGKVIMANEEAMRPFGLTPEKVTGKTVRDILPLEQAAFAIEQDNRVLKTGIKLESEMTGTVNGVERKFLSIRFPIRNETGKINYLGIVGLDITEVKNKEEALGKANKELESFAYSISHDLRTPLRAVHGYAQILKEDYSNQLGDDAASVIDVIVNNARKMGQLIDELLKFSRLGRQELQKTDVGMNDIVGDVLKELNGIENSRTLYKLQNLHTARADRVIIRQVWVNLISNALKYSGKKEKAVVEICSEDKGSEIVYHIKDNGAGFDMQHYNRLFGVFQRLHNDDEFEGIGVGLAIVNRIIAKHGGRVWAEAKVSEGATFSFSLPKSG